MTKKSGITGKDEYKALVGRKMEQIGRSRIPTEEDFARAHAHMAARNRMFATIRANVIRHFAGRIPLHDIFLFGGSTTDYEAYVFYETDADIDTAQDNGVEQEISDVICQEFASMSVPNSSTVAVKFDSHEKVKKQCNGNYWRYLH